MLLEKNDISTPRSKEVGFIKFLVSHTARVAGIPEKVVFEAFLHGRTIINPEEDVLEKFISDMYGADIARKLKNVTAASDLVHIQSIIETEFPTEVQSDLPKKPSLLYQKLEKWLVRFKLKQIN